MDEVISGAEGTDVLTGFGSEGTLSLAPTQAQGQGEGTLSVAPQSPTISRPEAQRQAAEAHYGLGEKSPGLQPLEGYLAGGSADYIRRDQAMRQALEEKYRRHQAAKTLIEEKKGAITPTDAQGIKSLLDADIAPKTNTVLEKAFASRFLNDFIVGAGKNNADSAVRKAFNYSEKESLSVMNAAEEIITKKKAAQNIAASLAAEQKDTSWAAWGFDMAKQLIPGSQTLAESKVDPNSSKLNPMSWIIPGTKRKERIEELHRMEPEDSIRQLKVDVDILKRSSLIDAQQYVNDYMNFSTSDQHLGNVFGVLDVVGVGVGATSRKIASKIATMGAKEAEVAATGAKVANAALNPTPIDRLKGLVTRAIKQTEPETISPTTTAAAAGDVLGAAKLEHAAGLGRPRMVDELRAVMPTWLKNDNFAKGSNRAAEEINRLETAARQREALMVDVVVNGPKIDRAPMAAREVGFEEAMADLKSRYTSIHDSVIDVQNIPGLVRTEKVLGENTVANVDKAAIILGKTDATLFPSIEQAKTWATDFYGMRQGQYQVTQEGDKFAIRVEKVVDETSPNFREAVRISTDNKTPENHPFSFVNNLLSADYQVSDFNRKNRKQLVSGLQEVQARVKQIAEPITNLSRTEAKALERVLTLSRLHYDELRNTYGKFDTTLNDLDKMWREVNGKLPTEKEINAYYAYVQLNDYDYVSRNLTIYRDKVRQGIESGQIQMHELKRSDGTPKFMPKFEVKLVDELPLNNTENFSVYFHDKDTPYDPRAVKNRNDHLLGGTDKETVDHALKNGYKLYQVANPESMPLAGITGDKRVINFILSKDMSTKNLDLKQIPYRAGGHFDYQNEWFVKQPMVERVKDANGNVLEHVYKGDQTVFNFSSKAQADKYAAHMDHARKLLKEGKTDELATYLNKNLPFEYGEFTGLFKEAKKVVNGVETISPARLNIDDTIRTVYTKQRLSDVNDFKKEYGENFKDTIRSSYNLWNEIDKKYAGQRDPPLWTVREYDETGKPILKRENADMIDPLPSMSRSIANVMRNSMMGDYKISSVESWVKEYGDLLKDVSPEALSNNPAMILHSAELRTDGENISRVVAAKASRQAIINLLGSESDLGQGLGFIKRRFVDWSYERMGQKAADLIVKSELLEKDPTKVLRGIAFHEKLGLFNPAQLFMQAQTAVHAMAIAGPVNGLQGLNGGTLMWMFRGQFDKPGMFDHVTGLAAKLGYDKKTFRESWEELRRSGMMNVEGEHAWKENLVDPTLFKGTASSWLDKGTVFFKEGERFSRLVAWNAAFLEWRKANPTKAITNEARRDIMDRVSNMTVNMTRDANASWQQGIMSLPTQFLSYNARLSEQLLGGKLTATERARVLTMYSALYGVPMAAAAPTGAVYSAYEDIRKAALERGYDSAQADLMTKAFADGIPSMLYKMATGTDMAIGERFGPTGNTLFRDILYGGDKPTNELIFGASNSILADNFKSASIFWKSAMSAFSTDPDTKFTPTMEDIISATSNISTVNNATKMIYAFNTGMWITKNNVKLDEVKTWDAVLMGITGMNTRSINDAFLMTKSLKDTKAAQDGAKKEIQLAFSRGADYLAKGDYNGYENMMRRVKAFVIVGGFQPKDMAEIYTSAAKQSMNTTRQIKQQFIDKAPIDQFQKRWEMIYNNGNKL